MFFACLCILIALLLVNQKTPDLYGWMMLVGVGWFSGYMDGRLFKRSDQDSDRVIPPDAGDDGRDAVTFAGAGAEGFKPSALPPS